MRNKKNYRNIRTKNYNKKDIIILIIIILITAMGVFLTYSGVTFKEQIASIYHYTIKKNSDYEVLLKPNDFYVTETLPKGGYYASKSIDSYQIDFQYAIDSNEKANFAYEYCVVADLVGTVNDNKNEGKQVWDRPFIIQEKQAKNEENVNEMFIQKQINIDYEGFNNLAREYERTYGITIDAMLQLHFYISYYIQPISSVIETEKMEDIIELNIPITSTITEVQENYSPIEEKDIFPTMTNNIPYQKVVRITLGILFLLGALWMIIVNIIKRRNTTPEEKYRRNINCILKYYGDLIVTVTNEPNISNLQVMKIADLNDLIDVAEQNQSNIIHYEAEKGKSSRLYVIIETYVYIYEVTEKKL